MVDFNEEADDFDFGGDPDMSSDFENKIIARLDVITKLLQIIAEGNGALCGGPPLPAPAPTPTPAPPMPSVVAQPAPAGAELVTIIGVDTATVNGKFGPSIKYAVKFVDAHGQQKSASTFKANIGAPAMPLQGRQAYIVVQPSKNPQYLDLVSVQAA